ncbi:site-specific DNA-methyltransferase [Aeromonas veronii]|uniref:site-specific DNA-methyltransferase n=1 Tax=Aeromonas veronii TaxID=654 RepID=UPI00130294CB|nr:site-specific DNA-methyltransferase [Aeromonas veronii]KAE9627142.1 site-specific DNA-methyltransferase [Aeromonas veronii]
MEKITAASAESKSLDITAQNIEQLKALFPDVFSEGKIDFDALKAELGEAIDDSAERYNFTWNGKTKARQIAQTPSTGTLRPCKEESVNWDRTENLFIEGDNLEVLKLLQKSYHKKVKMIYIDPPYNTGKDFVYKDNFHDNIKNYLEVTGQVDSDGNRLSTNSDTSGRYHSDWLNMMYPRLRLARNLLVETGVILVSIDENELSNLLSIMDEIFGEDNRLCTFVWKTRQASGKQIAENYSSVEHEYILAYGKSSSVKFKGIARDSSTYSNPDNDPRGIWAKHPLDVGSTREERPNCFYDLVDPVTGISYPANPNRVWAFAPESMNRLLSEGKILFHPTGKTKPYLKKFFSELKSENKPISTWLDRESFQIGYNTEGTKVANGLFENKKLFDYPKPVSIINLLIDQVLDDGDILLDFFAGSATSGHALLENNLKTGKKNKFILIQLPEPVSEKSLAYGEGYRTISELSIARLKAIIKKNDVEDGFKLYKLDETNIRPWDVDFDNLEQSLLNANESVKAKRTAEDVLYEILLKYGIELTESVEQQTIKGKQVFVVGAGALLVCLDDDITSEVVEGIAELKQELDPETTQVVFKDAGFADSVVKTNAIQILKQAGIDDVKSI